MMSPLNAATLELVGQHLIEASAGTGKTHNISLLYVRLLLERQFSVRQIAVVTFSDAATRELRSRLRRQLVEAIAHLDGSSASNRPDLDAILGRHRTDVAACARARTVLQAALVGFDEARISTLHSLCRQLLAEHAFETGLPFFELDDSAGKEVTREFVRDFWRRHVILEPDEAVADVLQRWKTPGDLAAELIRSQTLVLPVERMDPADVEGWLKRGRKTCASARKRWRDLHAKGTVAAALTQLQEAIDFGNLKSAQTSMLAQWRVQKCNAACAGEPDQVDVDALTPLRSSSIKKQISKNAEKAGWTLPAELAEVASVVEAMALADEDVRRALLAHFTRAAIDFVRERLGGYRKRARRLGFDDLIGQLHASLHGDSATHLAEAIASEVPALLVDEFQDTDPLQYAILHRIHMARADAVLLLIGDPKQAIYRFRGGDIYTYHAAARDAGSNLHTLRDNWRSDARLIEAVNAVFGGVTDPFMVDFIGFQPAQYPSTKNKPESWLKSDSPLTLWRLPDNTGGDKPKAWTIPQFSARILAEVAASISALLREAKQAQQPPPSIAVLVQTNRQAEQTAQVLGDWRIACDHVSTESVFLSQQASELEYLLAALDAPTDAARVRAALATELLGRNLGELLASRDDLTRWEAELALIAQLRQRWIVDGPYAALTACVRQAAARLLPRWDGPRCVTNFLHLAELLQGESLRRSAPGDLLHWLGQRRIEATQRPGIEATEQLRATADSAAVEVRTIHRSKGLQYDVVFAPFVMAARDESAAEKRNTPNDSVAWHAADELRIDIGGPHWQQHASAHADELFAESLRLAYVAMTRARHRLWLAWAFANTGKHVTGFCGPLAWLLFRTKGMCDPRQLAGLKDDLGAIDGRLQDLVERSKKSICVEKLDMEAPEPGLDSMTTSPQPLAVAEFHGHIERRLQTLSYSRLFGGGEHAPLADHDENSDPSAQVYPGIVDDPVPQWPRGAEFGTCVHGILETIPFADLANPAGTEALARMAADHGFADADQEVIAAMTRNCVSSELLPGSGFRLMHLRCGEFLPELEFLFPLGAARMIELERILARYPAHARSEGELQARRGSVLGLMTGFIDLIARWQGRYYVIDYKTNLLGASRADYAAARLPAAIRSNDYDLQYLVYLVALQRFLKHRLGAEYDYQRHIGGALYLFVRGMRDGDSAGIHHDCPPAELIDALDAWFDGDRS